MTESLKLDQRSATAFLSGLNPHGWVPFETVVVGGVTLVTASRQDLTDAMAADCLNARRRDVPARLVFDLNGQGLSLYETDPAFRQAEDLADVLHADGGFLVTLSRWIAGVAIKERTATTDLIHDFSARAAADGLSFYLLGGDEEVNARCAEVLMELYPGLRIVGRRNGFFEPGDEAGIVAEINAVKPDVLWVGLGKPKEQVFCAKYRRVIKAGWVMQSGGCYNYVTGHYRRAPVWMQRMNLEWLFRMVDNPRQLLWRYVVTTPHALFLGLLRTPRRQRPGRLP